MAQAQTHETGFFSPEQEDEIGYRRISRFAVVALLLAIVSPTALISPLLWIIPVLAVAFALVALRQIKTSVELTGRPLALAGLAIALLFGTWGASWTVSRNVILNRQAREHAERWFALVQQDKMYEAHQLSKPFFERMPSGKTLEAYYAENGGDGAAEPGASPRAQLVEFLQGEGVRELVALDGDFEAVYAGNMAVIRDGTHMMVVEQAYSIHYQQDGRPHEMKFKMRMKRSLEEGNAHWEVELVTKIRVPDKNLGQVTTGGS